MMYAFKCSDLLQCHSIEKILGKKTLRSRFELLHGAVNFSASVINPFMHMIFRQCIMHGHVIFQCALIYLRIAFNLRSQPRLSCHSTHYIQRNFSQPIQLLLRG